MQIGGIRFLYDNLVETVARYKVSAGFGCILAHSMGLGKTLQVIAFTDIFLRHTEAKKVLIVVPINTIQNWMAEFDMWIPPKPEVIDKDESNESTEQESGSIRYRNFNVYILGDSNKTTISRAKVIGKDSILLDRVYLALVENGIIVSYTDLVLLKPISKHLTPI